MRTILSKQDYGNLSRVDKNSPLMQFAAWEIYGVRKKKYNNNVLNDAKALLYIHKGISKVILPRIMGATISKDTWEILKNEFKNSDKLITIKL